MEGQPLLGVLRGLILDGEEQADFAADPSGYMQRAGYDDVSEDDLGEAVGLVADTLPPDVAHAVTTAAAGPEGEAAGDEGATGVLERLASIDAEDVPPLPIPPPAEPVDDVDDGFDDPGPLDDGDATAFGDVTTDFDDLGPGFDPFAEEAAEPSLESVEEDEGAVDLADAHDVDDDPIDFGEGIGTADATAAPGGAAVEADDADLDGGFAPDAFGSDAGFDEPAPAEPDGADGLDAAYGEDTDLDDGFEDDPAASGDVDDIGLF